MVSFSLWSTHVSFVSHRATSGNSSYVTDIESLVEGTYHCGSSDQTPLVTECAPIILKKSHKIIIAPSPDDVFFQISIQDQLALANMSWNFPGCSMSNYSGYNQDFASVNSAKVRIVEEPRSIGLRFRYPSEGRGAGVLQARDFFKMQLPLTIFNEIQLNHVSLSHWSNVSLKGDNSLGSLCSLNSPKQVFFGRLAIERLKKRTNHI